MSTWRRTRLAVVVMAVGATVASALPARAATVDRHPKPTAEAVSMWDARLRARLREKLDAGSMIAFHASHLSMRVTVTGVTAAGNLKARGHSTTAEVPWSGLTIRERRALALTALRDGFVDDHLMAAFYLRAAGDEAGAREHAAKSGDFAPMLDTFFELTEVESPEDGEAAAPSARPDASPARRRSIAVIRSTGLGWRAGEDVTDDFAALLECGKLQAGYELVLEHTYRIRGRHLLPDDVTISAVKGAGFDVTDGAKHGILFTLGNGTTLRNLTITYLGTPPLGPTGEKMGVTFTGRVGIAAHGKRDITIENCRLTGSIGHHIKLVDCHGFEFIGCHVAGGHWSLYLCSVSKGVLRRCVIEKCQGDGIKTGGGPSGCVREMLVEECVFQDNLRDGIDTTGGFNDSVIRNCIFRRLGVSGLDCKSHYQSKTGSLEGIPPENVGILVEKSLFHDMPCAFVFTTLDRDVKKGKPLLTADNMAEYAPHDIGINDCTFGYAENILLPNGRYRYSTRYPSGKKERLRMILLKDAYDIRYRNARFFSDKIKAVHHSSIGGGKSLSKEAASAIKSGATGNVLSERAPQVEPGITEPPFACGPQ